MATFVVKLDQEAVKALRIETGIDDEEYALESLLLYVLEHKEGIYLASGSIKVI